MRIRRATDADLATLAALWRAFEVEVPAPPWVDVDSGEELGEIAATVRDEIALIAEDATGGVLGFALARRKGPRRGFLSDLYVRPEARRAGVAPGSCAPCSRARTPSTWSRWMSMRNRSAPLRSAPRSNSATRLP